jgi:preprotein translocase subunit SecB
MAETEDQNTAAPQQQPATPQMRIMSQFIRDMSFENIAARDGLSGNVSPDIQVQVALDAKKKQDNTFEVVMKLNITSTNKDTNKTMFVLEIEYGGVFLIENVPDQQLHPFLLIECPRMLFPFVRRVVSDITHDGGFPPLNLDVIDFVSLYRQSIENRVAAAKAAETQPN